MNSTVGLIAYMGFFFVLMYFLIIRPQKKKTKQLNDLRGSVKAGDTLVTIGGIVGTVVKVKEDEFVIEVLLNEIKAKGVKLAFVTLHVGLGTFRPVKVEDVNSHKMHSEYYELDDENAQIINEAKANGGRIISVGTTSTRTLETIADENGIVKAQGGWTEIFIYPGYRFKVVDGLITNFHLPESTLIMLVSAFLDRETVLNAYQTAVNEKYRFFSFGDAMLIL